MINSYRHTGVLFTQSSSLIDVDVLLCKPIYAFRLQCQLSRDDKESEKNPNIAGLLNHVNSFEALVTEPFIMWSAG
jgi:hypothetical protein